jgi:hypothetical protein
MTNRNNILTFTLTVFALVLMSATAVASENAEKKAFTGTEVFFSPMDPGHMTYEGGNIHLRGEVIIYQWVTSDTRLTGYIAVVINGNFDSTFTGPMWGTFQSVDKDGEPIVDGWEGTWNGEIFEFIPNTLSNWVDSGVGHGTGKYKGLKFEFSTAYGGPPIGITVGVIQGKATP